MCAFWCIVLYWYCFIIFSFLVKVASLLCSLDWDSNFKNLNIFYESFVFFITSRVRTPSNFSYLYSDYLLHSKSSVPIYIISVYSPCSECEVLSANAAPRGFHSHCADLLRAAGGTLLQWQDVLWAKPIVTQAHSSKTCHFQKIPYSSQ